MLVSIQDLRSIQERCEIGELVQRLDVSIDRLSMGKQLVEIFLVD